MHHYLTTLTILLTLLMVACTQQPPTYPQRTPPKNYENPAALSAGAKIFKQKCAICHGHTHEGRTPRANFFKPAAPDFLASRYKEVDPAYLFWRIRTGKTEKPYLSQGSVMPAWNDHLSNIQIWDLVAYLRARSR